MLKLLFFRSLYGKIMRTKRWIVCHNLLFVRRKSLLKARHKFIKPAQNVTSSDGLLCSLRKVMELQIIESTTLACDSWELMSSKKLQFNINLRKSSNVPRDLWRTRRTINLCLLSVLNIIVHLISKSRLSIKMKNYVLKVNSKPEAFTQMLIEGLLFFCCYHRESFLSIGFEQWPSEQSSGFDKQIIRT